MSARWDDAAAGWPSRNAPRASFLFTTNGVNDDGAEDDEMDARSWRRNFVQSDGWPQPVPLLACAIVSFAVPVCWALFVTEAETVEQLQHAQSAARNSTRDVQASNINPWEQIGTMRSIVIFLACGTWLTCLWVHVVRLSVAEQRRRRQSPHSHVREEPHKIAHGLQAILDTPLPMSEPSGSDNLGEESSDSSSSNLYSVQKRDRRKKVTNLVTSSSSDDDDEISPSVKTNGEVEERRCRMDAASERDSIESLTAEIACLELQKQQYEKELALRRSRRENKKMLQVRPSLRPAMSSEQTMSARKSQKVDTPCL